MRSIYLFHPIAMMYQVVIGFFTIYLFEFHSRFGMNFSGRTHMARKRLVVIGGNAAGMAAAARARRLNKDLEIKVYEKSPHVSYAP